jgi:hypothetical protein
MRPNPSRGCSSASFGDFGSILRQAVLVASAFLARLSVVSEQTRSGLPGLSQLFRVIGITRLNLSDYALRTLQANPACCVEIKSPLRKFTLPGDDLRTCFVVNLLDESHFSSTQTRGDEATWDADRSQPETNNETHFRNNSERLIARLSITSKFPTRSIRDDRPCAVERLE